MCGRAKGIRLPVGQKARRNLRIHQLSFEKASTVFGDTLSRTIEALLHSEAENRYVIIGQSIRRRLLVVVHTTRGDPTRIISARVAMPRGKIMKTTVRTRRDPDMLNEYDFSRGVRGKYAKRYAEGTNIVVLSPDVAAIFPDSESVNAALGLVKIARQRVKKIPA